MEGQVHALYYTTRTLNEAKLNYATTKKSCYRWFLPSKNSDLTL
jgi:hypothetical protein